VNRGNCKGILEMPKVSMGRGLEKPTGREAAGNADRALLD
jgi:hypothetical protein